MLSDDIKQLAVFVREFMCNPEQKAPKDYLDVITRQGQLLAKVVAQNNALLKDKVQILEEREKTLRTFNDFLERLHLAGQVEPDETTTIH